MSSSYARYVNVARDRTGQAVGNATIRVYVGDSTQLAQLYDGDGNPVAQPLSTDVDGVIRNGTSGAAGVGFKVAGGRYRIEGSGGGQDLVPIRDIRLGTAQGYDVGDIQALPNPGVYTDTDSGLANTLDRGYFWVPESDELTLYQNDAGTAVEQSSYPDLKTLGSAANVEADQNLRTTDEVEHAKHVAPDTSSGTKYAMVMIDGLPYIEEQ